MLSLEERLMSGFGSVTTLVLIGWNTRSHWVRIAWRAPAHFPGPVRRYWYGVQGPKKPAVPESLKKSYGMFGLTPTSSDRESM